MKDTPNMYNKNNSFDNSVSIITSTFNSSQYISEAIESILNQSYNNWELLITDDCSADSTWQILEEYAQKDQRIKIFKLSHNIGAGGARNHSIKNAKGRYIAFCDSDDLWKPAKLEKQLSFMKEKNCGLSYSNCDVIDEYGAIIGKIVPPCSVNYQKMIKNDYIPCCTAMYDRGITGEILMPTMRKSQDYAFWLNILKNTGSAFKINESLSIYRNRVGSNSSNKFKLLKYNWLIYKNQENNTTVKSIFLFLQFLFFHLHKKRMKIPQIFKLFSIVCFEVFLLVFAIFLSLWIRYQQIPAFDNFARHLNIFMPIILIWILCSHIAGFYSFDYFQTRYKTFSQLLIISITTIFLGFAFFYLNVDARMMPRITLLLYSAVAFILFFLWRWIYEIIAFRYAKTKIAFVGFNDTVSELLESVVYSNLMRYNVVSIFSNHSISKTIPVPSIDNFDDFLHIIKRNDVKMVIVAEDQLLFDTAQNVLINLMLHRVCYVDINSFYETLKKELPLFSINELWLLKNMNLLSKKIYRMRVKPVIDVLLSILFLTLTLPFWLIIIALIKIENPGSVFVYQPCVGFLGKPFSIIRFRTMRAVINNHDSSVSNNSQISRIGKLLQRTRFDKIPQLINVLKSDMSLIGPCPEQHNLVSQFELTVPFYRQRLLVKPGLTGWEQVSRGYHSPSQIDTIKKLQKDLFYIKNVSFPLDISIFYRTFLAIFWKFGK